MKKIFILLAVCASLGFTASAWAQIKFQQLNSRYSPWSNYALSKMER